MNIKSITLLLMLLFNSHGMAGIGMSPKSFYYEHNDSYPTQARKYRSAKKKINALNSSKEIIESWNRKINDDVKALYV